MDREKFISQLSITEKDIDKYWIMDVLRKSIDSNLHDGNPRGHRNLIRVEYHKLKELNCNPLEYLKNMIAEMSTVIMCSENDKKKLEEQELPGMTTILSNQYLEDGTVYMITDEKLKRDMLECERIRRLREKKTDKSN